MTETREVPNPSHILDGRVPLLPQSEVDWRSYVQKLADSQGHWLSYAFKGFEQVKKLKGDIKHFVSIGTGSGLDAIGAIEIMQPKRVTVTDVAPAFLNRARENILLYQANAGRQVPVTFGLGNPLRTS